MKVIQSFSWAEFVLCEYSVVCAHTSRNFVKLTIAYCVPFLPLKCLPPVTILFVIILNLGLGASARGYNEVWNGSISDLGWYGEETPNREGSGYGGYPLQQQGIPQQGVSYTYPNVQTFGGSQPVYQLPGHSVVITNGPNGAQGTFPHPYSGFI